MPSSPRAAMPADAIRPRGHCRRLTFAAFAFASASALAVVLAPAPAAAQTAEAAIRTWIADLDATPEFAASFRSLMSDPSTGETVVAGLAIRSEAEDGAALSVDRMSVADYAETADGGFSARAVTIDAGRIDVGPLSFRLDDVRLDGLGVPDYSDFAFAPDRPFTSIVKAYAIVAAARLDSGRAERFRLVQDTEGVESEVVYENLELRGFRDGAIASMTAGPLAMTSPAPEGLVTFRVARMESRDTGLAAIVHVYDPDRYQGGTGDGAWRQALGLGAYRGIVVEAPGSKISIGDIVLENLRVRQPARSFAPLMDTVMARPDMPAAEMERLVGEHLPDLLSALSIGRLGFRDLDVSGAGVETFRIGSFAISDLSLEGGLREVALDDFAAAVAGQGSVAFDRFAFGDIVLPPLAVLRQAIAAGTGGPEPNPLTLLPQLGFIETNGLAVAASDKTLLSLDRSRLDLGAYVGAVPTDATLAVGGLEIARSALQDRRAISMLTDLGYETIRLDAGFRAGWRETERTVAVDDLRIDLADMGTLDADIDLAGLTREMLADPEKLSAALSGLAFSGGTVRVEDRSLLGRVLAMQAKKLGLTEEQFRNQITGALPFMLMMLRNPEFQAQLTPALQAFIKGAGSLVLAARPADPVPLDKLAETARSAPQRLPNLLDVEVKAGE